MSFISHRFGQFKYFDVQLGQPVWRGKKVLDFGGNVGNILRDPASTIDHDRYWSIDVSREAIESGKRAFPEAHWLFYDRYSFAFNQKGIEGLALPAVGQEFDFILAYSVFSHIGRTEMMELVSELEKWLTVDGVLAFTFIDPHFNPATNKDSIHPGYYDGSCLRQRLERLKQNEPSVDVESLLEKASDARWCILLNNDDLYLESENLKQYAESEKKSFCSFYTPGYIQTIFPDAVVLPPPYSAYPQTEEAVLQHCCLIRKARR